MESDRSTISYFFTCFSFARLYNIHSRLAVPAYSVRGVGGDFSDGFSPHKQKTHFSLDSDSKLW